MLAAWGVGGKAKKAEQPAASRDDDEPELMTSLPLLPLLPSLCPQHPFIGLCPFVVVARGLVDTLERKQRLCHQTREPTCALLFPRLWGSACFLGCSYNKAALKYVRLQVHTLVMSCDDVAGSYVQGKQPAPGSPPPGPRRQAAAQSACPQESPGPFPPPSYSSLSGLELHTVCD